jgi:hypothetical protein
VKVSKKLEKTLSTLTIDFDAAESVKESNGTYKLQPVLKLKILAYYKSTKKPIEYKFQWVFCFNRVPNLFFYNFDDGFIA